MKTLTLKIEGMSCGHCAATVRKALERVDGIEILDVGIGSATVRLGDGIEDAAARSNIARAISDAGYRLESA